MIRIHPMILSLLAGAFALAACEPRTASTNSAIANTATTGAGAAGPTMATSDASSRDSSPDEQRYMRENIKVYDVDGRFFDSILDGRVPGVRFKIKNMGDQTLKEVRVRLLFKDQAGTVIYENDYSPVLAGGLYDSDPPLRPNYVWQNDRNEFYSPRGIPSEVDPQKTEIRVIDIEFAPAGASGGA